MDDALEALKLQVGLELVQLGALGVYTYCLADPDQRSIASCSVISSAGLRVSAPHFRSLDLKVTPSQIDFYIFIFLPNLKRTKKPTKTHPL